MSGFTSVLVSVGLAAGFWILKSDQVWIGRRLADVLFWLVVRAVPAEDRSTRRPEWRAELDTAQLRGSGVFFTLELLIAAVRLRATASSHALQTRVEAYRRAESRRGNQDTAFMVFLMVVLLGLLLTFREKVTPADKACPLDEPMLHADPAAEAHGATVYHRVATDTMHFSDSATVHVVQAPPDA